MVVAVGWPSACSFRYSKEDANVNTQMQTTNQKGRVAVPMLLWMAGVPFTLVLLLWLFFFRGH